MHTEEKKRPHGLEAWGVNRGGHFVGHGLANMLWSRGWVRHLVAKNPALAKLISEGAIGVTSMFELGGDHPITRLLNFIAESFAMENLELLEKFEKDPENMELGKEVEKRMAVSVDKAEKEVIIAFDHIHKDAKCVPVATLIAATTTTRAGKDGKSFTSPSPITLVTTDMSSALAAGRPLCGVCYPAVSVTKPEEADKPKGVVPGRNFMEYLMRLQKEEPGKFQTFWGAYLIRLEGPDGAALARKFQDAFNGKHSYEAFRFVIDRPDRNATDGEEWHHALDALLGQVTPADSLKKTVMGFLDEEKRQTKEMIDAAFAWIERSNKARAKKIAEKQASIAALDEAWANRKAKPGFWSARNIVIICLTVILAAAWLITRTDNANNGSDTSEQKVETPNVR